MNTWIRFFLGTPKRFSITCAGLAILTIVIEPTLLCLVAERLWMAVEPLADQLIMLVIVVLGLRIFYSWVCGGKGKK